MVHPNIPFLRSVGLMIGAIVGVGVFGLPYAFAQSGLALGLLELFAIGGLVLVLNLMFAEVVTQTHGSHRLVGYVAHYLGGRWKYAALTAMACAIWGAMLAYMIVGGTFLSLLFSVSAPETRTALSFVVGIVAAGFIWGGLRFAARVEILVVLFLLFLFAFVIFASVPHLSVANLLTLDIGKAFIPYGVILFALSGSGIVPEMKAVLGTGHKRSLVSAILLAVAVIVALYTLFSFAVVGATGAATTSMSFDGLALVLGDGFVLVAALLGALTIFSIYLVLGVELLNILKFDFRLPHPQAWLLTTAVPVLLFALGLREFITIVGFVGGVFGGFVSILVALTYWKMRLSPWCRTHHCVNFPAPLTWVLVGIFAIGMLLEIVQTFTLTL
ncbi:hypothetical protein HY631_02445 [Candidatus Uhrbacteria bacterium]|nr:hypothetical protein [Candidatus Uhrbacteria bacterium]